MKTIVMPEKSSHPTPKVGNNCELSKNNRDFDWLEELGPATINVRINFYLPHSHEREVVTEMRLTPPMLTWN
jgi:hypothetical protein